MNFDLHLNFVLHVNVDIHVNFGHHEKFDPHVNVSLHVIDLYDEYVSFKSKKKNSLILGIYFKTKGKRVFFRCPILGGGKAQLDGAEKCDLLKLGKNMQTLHHTP